MTPEDFVRWIHSRRFSLGAEKALQEEMSRALEGDGIDFERELRLSASDVVDFMLPGGIAVEVKLQGQRRAIFRQCERYCAHDAVTSLVLATSLAMGFPPAIGGKPCYVASLGRAWML